MRLHTCLSNCDISLLVSYYDFMPQLRLTESYWLIHMGLIKQASSLILLIQYVRNMKSSKCKNVGSKCRHCLGYHNLEKLKACFKALDHPGKVVWLSLSVEDARNVICLLLKSEAGVSKNFDIQTPILIYRLHA